MGFEETPDSGEHVEVVIPGFRALFLDFQCGRHMLAWSLSQDLFKCLELEEEEDSLFMDFRLFLDQEMNGFSDT